MASARMRAGIVGNGTDKFTAAGQVEARRIIREIVKGADVVISGHSPVGGVDIWAEEEAEAQGVMTDLKIPSTKQWNPPGGYGYKARNLDIANDSDVVHVILADVYPVEYDGMRFNLCYHCRSDDHVKSGACWTGKRAVEAGKDVRRYVIANYPEPLRG